MLEPELSTAEIEGRAKAMGQTGMWVNGSFKLQQSCQSLNLEGMGEPGEMIGCRFESLQYLQVLEGGKVNNNIQDHRELMVS